MSSATYLLFAFCVALATYVQNLSGFAFSLILLGLVGVLRLASIHDAANAATVLTLANAAVYFRQRGLKPEWRVMKPAIPASWLGVALGVAALHWLSAHAVDALRMLLGIAILVCALLLLRRGPPLPQVSRPGSFMLIGGLSGLLGGLFSSAGPPLVYLMYRQPLARELVQQCLILMFALNALLRLALVLAGGDFSHQALLLSACAVPVVYAVNTLQHRYPLQLDLRKTQLLVGALLMLTGAMLLGSGLLFFSN